MHIGLLCLVFLGVYKFCLLCTFDAVPRRKDRDCKVFEPRSGGHIGVAAALLSSVQCWQATEDDVVSHCGHRASLSVSTGTCDVDNTTHRVLL